MPLELGLVHGLALLGPIYVTLSITATATLHKERPDLSASRLATYFAIKVVHFAIATFQMAYLLVFAPRYDLWLLFLHFAVTLHWILFKNECIISYFERKVMEPDYVMGSDPYREQDRSAGGPLVFAGARIVIMTTAVIVIIRSALPVSVKWALIALAVMLDGPVILKRFL
jgi:hypothetical protein